MRFSLGMLDWLFGEKITVELPTANGAMRRFTVTKKWHEKMIAEGKIQEAAEHYVQVHVIDPSGYHVVPWTIGTHISKEQHAQFLDKETDSLYACMHFENGQPRMTVMKREFWEQVKKETISG
jgi:hypothetical protein